METSFSEYVRGRLLEDRNYMREVPIDLYERSLRDIDSVLSNKISCELIKMQHYIDEMKGYKNTRIELENRMERVWQLLN